MADNCLRVDDDSSEVSQIEALADLSIVRDLEVVLPGELIESRIPDLEQELVEQSSYSVILGDLVIVISDPSHRADIAKLRGRTALFKIACIDVLKTAGVARVSEQISVYYVLKLVSHARSSFLSFTRKFYIF